MNISVLKLDSGIGYAFKRISSPVAYCALSIKAGTRDESIAFNGLAHLTEHMLFKGTTKRGAVRINNYLESLGGELNAYTTKEETVIHATVLKEDIARAIELLSDLAFNSKFPLKELLKEREIVLDEICSYKDQPSEMIFDDFDELLFEGHPLSMPILGKRKSVEKIGVEEIMGFCGRYYLPSNMAFSIVADIDEGKGATLVNRHFGRRENNGVAPNGLKHPEDLSCAVNSYAGEILRRPKKNFQAHCVIGTSAYSMYNDNRIPLALLTNILGGPALNSRLNQSMREKHALAYTVDASYTPYTDTGLFTIYFGTDKGNIDKCLEIVGEEINLLKEMEIKPNQLKAAKKQLLGQLAIANDNAEAQCLAMGKSLLFHGKIEPIETVMEKIAAVDAAKLYEVSRQIFDGSRLFTLIYS